MIGAMIKAQTKAKNGHHRETDGWCYLFGIGVVELEHAIPHIFTHSCMHTLIFRRLLNLCLRGDAEFDDEDGHGMVDGGEDEPMDGESGALSVDIQIANIFYEAEDMKRENPQVALAKFQQVAQLANKAKADGVTLNEESKTNHFNAIVHIVCLLYQLNTSEAREHEELS